MEDTFAAGLVGIVLDGRYRLDALLGEGGMGAVYRAHHLAMDRKVAVKLLKPHLTQDDAALQRFAREARSTLKVESPHAVKVLDYGVTPQHDYYMVLEYLDGRTVQRELDVDGLFAAARVIHIAKQALGALGAAHKQGIVHRDIKPDNLLLMKVGDDPDYAKVLDFGVAKLMEGTAQSAKSALAITQAGMVFGTPEFMSPEQACGHALDGRSDLYSLAATMFAMLTGCGLFQAKTAIEWLTNHARTPPPHIADVRPDLEAFGRLDALLQRCLAKRPDDRPRDAEQMSSLLDDVDRLIDTPVDDSGRGPAAPAQLRSTFSASSYVAALPPNTLGPMAATARPEAPTMFAPQESTGASEISPHGRRGTWLAIGAIAIVGMVVTAIAIASRGKTPTGIKESAPSTLAVGSTSDATWPVPVPVVADAGVIASEDAGSPDAAVGVASHPIPVPISPRTNGDVSRYITGAEEAQRQGKRMRQINQADAALRIDPKNVRAKLLLADGLIAYGDLDHGCKYLRELGRNPIAVQRAHQAGCPAD